MMAEEEHSSHHDLHILYTNGSESCRYFGDLIKFNLNYDEFMAIFNDSFIRNGLVSLLPSIIRGHSPYNLFVNVSLRVG